MSLKFRLILSYLAMLVIPILLSAVASFLVGLIYIGDAGQAFNLPHGPKAFREVFRERQETINEVKINILKQPEKALSKSFWAAEEKKLVNHQTYLVVKKGKDLIYASELMREQKLLEKLPAFGNPEEEGAIKAPDGKRYLLKQVDFYFSDKTPGSIYFITDVENVRKILTRFSITMLVVFLLILVATNGTLTFLVSRSILKPLSQLKQASEQIKNGNLDFTVKNSAKDEIGELFVAFEEMRKRLKESEELKKQYEENRKELIANISHDLKTPITAIKGYVEGIRDGVADSPEKLSRYVDTIYRKILEVDGLIDELFLFSKLDLKKLPFNFEKVNLNRYLSDVAEELEFDLRKKGIELKLHLPCQQVFVWADREKLKRVINNIVDNSVKFMDKENSQVVINVKDEEKRVIIEIADNGRGIPLDAIPKIFERFYRVDSARTGTSGSGLGLSIAAKIIEEHGGEIWANSVLNEGTTISFTLKKLGEGA
ncbi:sensor histidine kinase [Carboxydothermus hydrogenoformans]|uniref:histidine kinase n=1 Tax=Carboxydothermus hydrogenoformans (strain ATCC BAA-161 / DSM 6008 / Z-2901) TaxID=246194 RepID=Q3AFX1_CARHZ|nr:HAMP domain-containing sensor histidine kinase [Carboxydothermus hydrogenoformans]ABB14272.1 sensor histidine kinase [Carboxydothermus hydrogenoformans Z-2901]